MSLSGNQGFNSIYSETVGGLPEDQQTISPARATAKWIHNLRGVEIIQLGSTYPGMEVHCIEDYLTIHISGHTYVRNATNDNWLDTTQKKHLHFQDSDQDGGELHGIETANATEWVRKDYDPCRASQWYVSTLGGEVANSTASLVMTTNNVGGNYLQLINGGNRVLFEKAMKLLYRFELITDHSKKTSFRGGVNCEEVWETSNIRRMFGNEFCDDVGQDKFYLIFSSDGSERNAVVTSLSANNVNDEVHALQLSFIPSGLIRMIYDGSNVLATKADAVPRTLATTRVDTLKFGLKTNEDQTKQYRLSCVRLVGKMAMNYQPW